MKLNYKVILPILTLFLVLFLYLLYRNYKDQHSNKLVFSIELNKGMKISDFVHDIQYVGLNTELIQKNIDVQKIILSHNKIYLLANNEKALLIFGIDGEFIAKIDQAGKEGGKFLLPNDFLIDKNSSEISILDVNRNELITYYNSKNKISKIGFTAFYFMKSDLDLFYFDTGNMVLTNKPGAKLIITDSQMKILDFKFEIGKQAFLSIFKYSTFSRNKNTLYYSPLFSQNIYILDSLTLRLHKKIDFGENNFNEDIIDNNDDPKAKYSKVTNSNFVYNFTNYFEDSNWTIFNYFFKKNMNIAYYNKKTGRSYAGNSILNDIDRVPLSTNYWTQDDCLVFLVDYGKLVSKNIKNNSRSTLTDHLNKNNDVTNQIVLAIAHLNSI